MPVCGEALLVRLRRVLVSLQPNCRGLSAPGAAAGADSVARALKGWGRSEGLGEVLALWVSAGFKSCFRCFLALLAALRYHL